MKLWPFTRAPEPVPEQKNLANPDERIWEVFAPSVAGIPVSTSTALRVPAVASAIRVISEAVATLDIAVMRVDENGVEVPAPEHPAQYLLSGEANPWTSGFELIRDLTVQALMDDPGGLAWVNRSAGAVREIIQPARGAITVNADTLTGEPSYALQGRRLPSDDVIHLRSPLGRAPLTLAKEAIGVAQALDRHAANLFSRGARPSGALVFPKGMGEESVRKARAAWQATHEGRDAEGRTAILYDGAEFEAFTFKSTDSQFLENRSFQILEIARAFRVPPTMLFQLERATWSNTEQLGREFLSYCLEPWLRALEGALRRALLTEEERRSYVIRFDRDDLTRADLNTRSTVINSLIAARVINANEGRAWLGLGPYEGGEQFANPFINPERTDNDAQ